MAVAVYLKDEKELAQAAHVFKSWLGDRNSYAGLRYGADSSWQSDPKNPVGINPKGARKKGRNIDGVLPDDQRRAGSFSWPPPKENYVYEALQGALTQAVILHRAGYDAWNWGDRALLRAYKWLNEVASYPAQGDDTWQTFILDHYYGTSYSKGLSTSNFGKNIGFTDWTHGARPGLDPAVNQTPSKDPRNTDAKSIWISADEN